MDYYGQLGEMVASMSLWMGYKRVHFFKAIGDYVRQTVGKYDGILGKLPLELAILGISLIYPNLLEWWKYGIPTSNGFSLRSQLKLP